MTAPADDDNRRITEPRVRFYLDHRAQIEEWGALRVEAGRALHELLLGLVDELVVEVEERGELVPRTVDLDKGGYPRLVLEDPKWRAPTELNAPYGLALEWERTTIASGGQARVYVTVRADTDHPRYDSVREAVRSAAAGWKRQLGAGWQGTSMTWPCYRYLHASSQALDEVELLLRARQDLFALADQLRYPLGDLVRPPG